jgi:hypothetical protein
MVKVAPNHRKKEKERISNLKKTNPRSKQRRVMGSQIRTLESGSISTKSPGTTPMNVAQNNHYWLR